MFPLFCRFTMGTKRLFVGNLFADVAEKDLKKLLGEHGTLTSADIKYRRDVDGKVASTFAFVEMADMSDVGLRKCIQKCNGLTWKQHKIKVQQAEESFLQRLARERREAQEKEKTTTPEKKEKPADILVKPAKHDSFKSKFDFKADKLDSRKQPSDSNQWEEKMAPKFDSKAGGKVVNGVVCFDDEDGETKAKRSSALIRKYVSSSDEDSDDEKFKQNRKKPKTEGRGDFLQSLARSNPSFWGGSDSEEEEKTETIVSKEDSNARRLKALQERKNTAKTNSYLVKKSLSNFDERKKKLVKEDEEDSSKVSLFDKDDDGDDSDGDDFRIREQFQGEGGQSLLALQSSFTSRDSRFKTDNRFAEKGNEKATKSKTKQTLKKSKSDKSFGASVRYDPDDQEHQKYEADDDDDDDDSDEEIEPNKPPKEAPKVSEDKSFFVQTDLFKAANTAPSTSKSSFSFGFQNSTNGKELSASDSSVSQKITSKKGKQLAFLERNPFKFDSSSENEEEVECVAKTSNSFTEKLASRSMKQSSEISEPFFILEGDKRLDEVPSFFKTAEELQAVRDNYDNVRPILSEIRKKKIRRKTQKQEQASFGAKKKRKFVTRKKGKTTKGQNKN